MTTRNTLKHLARAAGLTLGLSLFISGCGTPEPGTDTSTPDTQTPAPKTANVTVKWSFKKADGTADTACAAPYNKVRIVSQAYSTTMGGKTGDAFGSALFDCSTGSATLKLQTSGDIANTGGFTPTDVNGQYDIKLVLTEGSGEIEHIVTYAQKANLASGDKSLTFTFYPNAGFRFVNWAPRAQSTSDLISCAAAGVDTVKLRSTRTHTPDYTPDPVGKETVDTFPCTGVADVPVTSYGARGGGISSPLEPGYYTFVIEAYSGGTRVGVSETKTEQLVENRGRENGVSDGYFLDITTR